MRTIKIKDKFSYLKNQPRLLSTMSHVGRQSQVGQSNNNLYSLHKQKNKR
jgi:hypothetical protein